MIAEGIYTLIEAADREPHRFPPTLIFSEGWMLRLVLHWFESRQITSHPLALADGATWFSEALLPSPFAPRHRGDRRAEARTHADGLVGHFAIGNAAKADATFLPDGTQLVVVEAKMHSPLSGGTRNAPEFDQAARNVACIAELLTRAQRQPSEVRSLAFLVLAPEEHVREGIIAAKLEKSSIERAVRARAQAFLPELEGWLHQWFLPTLEAVTAKPIAWEQVIREIAAIDEDGSHALASFYERCLKYNSPRGKVVPA